MKRFLCAAIALTTMMSAPAMAEHGTRYKSSNTKAVYLDKKDTQDLQQALRDTGFNKKAVTGVWDENTTDALYSYQVSNGLAATGTLNDATVKQLGLRPSAQAKVTDAKAKPMAHKKHKHHKKMMHKDDSMAHKEMAKDKKDDHHKK